MIMHVVASDVGILCAITSYPFRRVNASVRLCCVNTQTKISENNRDCTMVSATISTQYNELFIMFTIYCFKWIMSPYQKCRDCQSPGEGHCKQSSPFREQSKFPFERCFSCRKSVESLIMTQLYWHVDLSRCYRLSSVVVFEICFRSRVRKKLRNVWVVPTKNNCFVKDCVLLRFSTVQLLKVSTCFSTFRVSVLRRWSLKPPKLIEEDVFVILHKFNGI